MQALPDLMSGAELAAYEGRLERLVDNHVPVELASQVAGSFSSAYSFGELGDFVFSGEAGEGAGAGTRAGAESGAEVVGSSGREAVLPPVFSRATVPAAGLAEALAPPPRGGKGAAGARKHLGGLAAGRGPRARKTGGSG